MDVQEFIKYLSIQRNFSAHTAQAYALDLEQCFQFLSGQYEIRSCEELKSFQIRSWIISMMEAGLAPSSISRKVSALKSYLKWLRREGRIAKNPALGLVLPKKKKRLPVFVDELGLNQLFDSDLFSGRVHGERDRLILEMFYYTGMRESELIGLKLRDVDLYNGQVKVLGKRNKERIIPLTQDFVKRLRSFIDWSTQNGASSDAPLFLTDSGKKMYPKFVYNKVNYYLSLVSNTTQKSPHILRHSFATHMLNNGADINAIKSILGHESLAATQVYTHTQIDKLKNIHKQAHPRG